MYSTLLTLHSWFRWLVLVSLFIAVYRAYKGWRYNRTYSRFDNSVKNIATTFAYIQLVIGLSLYFLSPIVAYFIDHFRETVHQRELRFFGMEHIVMMLSAIIVITIGSIKIKRKTTDQEKFKIMTIWFSIGLLIILASIPWGIAFLVSRPYLRSW